MHMIQNCSYSCVVSRHKLYLIFSNNTATTEIYTLSLHDALPISPPSRGILPSTRPGLCRARAAWTRPAGSFTRRSEEHTSELQSQSNLVCRLLLEKKNQHLDFPFQR